MNRIECFAGSIGSAVQPLEIGHDVVQPLTCFEEAVGLVARIGKAVKNAELAMIQTPGRHAFAGYDQGGFHRVEEVTSSTAPSALLSAVDLIDIAARV
ncbi:hypothetical protein [Kutzneria buriramensis]|uniref:Uncharacterized protein n=1 Tax=Kutzneria buriramensis TaxID=1045776 RepID=A0A3E0GW74_9PSEU|nr:hypothetical protein [Kutzneria buriramensis]REH28586.1 hypothetical protein BCF44_12628 [Kutzneria buriramensis]